MRAGELDRRIDLQRSQSSQSSTGQPLETWGTIATVWASVAAVRGDEPFVPPQYAAKQIGEFRIRYSSDVAGLTPKDRIIWPSGHPSPKAIHNIISVNELGRGDGIRILAYRRDDL